MQVRRGRGDAAWYEEVLTPDEAASDARPEVRTAPVWRECFEVGAWCRSDDGYVLRLRALSTYPSKKVWPQGAGRTVYRRFSVGKVFALYKWVPEGGPEHYGDPDAPGAFVAVGRVRFLVAPFLRHGNRHGVKPYNAWIEESRRRRFKRMMTLYGALFVVRLGRLTTDDYVMLGRVYRADERQPATKARWLLRQSWCQPLKDEAIARMVGMTTANQERVNEMIEETFQLAREKGRTEAMLGAVDRLQAVVDRAEQKQALGGGGVSGGFLSGFDGDFDGDEAEDAEIIEDVPLPALPPAREPRPPVPAPALVEASLIISPAAPSSDV